MVKGLLEAGYGVVRYDNLEHGHRDALVGGDFVEGDIADQSLVRQTIERYRVAAVMHFASYIEVGESVSDPIKYYRNNVAATVQLLEVMRAAGVHRFIFSSSAAVYGEPSTDKLSESHPKAPLNPYGHSKWIIEQVLGGMDAAYAFRSVSLRYFNAAGADPDGRLGERHEPETHLIPLVLKAAAGTRPNIKVFGNDYDTTDGTCVRDYVHVTELCAAHLLGLEWLLDGGATNAFNLGNGFSVREVISAAERVTGHPISVIDYPRRFGDPARLVADSTRAQAELGWKPRYNELDVIIRHAWQWEQRLPA